MARTIQLAWIERSSPEEGMDPERTRVIHRDLTRTYPTLVRGEGINLFDDEGRRYIDGSGGSAAVTAIGHGVPEVASAIAAQAARLAYSPSHAFTNEAVEECARLIIERFAPEGFGKVWFVSGGSEATENAVKMALQYHRERGQGTRHLVIGRRLSFHGATIAALAFGGNAGRRRPYAAILSGRR
jgi:adenosylmethionine-8-amino-7-oxononanoate aminotransferase